MISEEAINKLYASCGYTRNPKPKDQLTMDEIREEVKRLTDVEHQFGFLYFCLEYVAVSHPTKGAAYFRDEMYNWQIKAAVDFLTGTQMVSKKVRQVGYSTITGAYCLWRALFFESQNIAIISFNSCACSSLCCMYQSTILFFSKTLFRLK